MHPTTHQNLQKTMRDEAFACRRYILDAREARSSGDARLADLFDALADSAVVDALMEKEDRAGLAASVRDAIAFEARGAGETYDLFERQARAVGDDEIADLFGEVRATKEQRWTRLAAALGSIEASVPKPHRILVIANESCQGSGLCDELTYRAGRIPSEVFVVAPALTRSRLHYLASDLDRETEQAAERIDTLRRELDHHHIPMSGRVGDANPLVAIEDALREFPADEIVIATHPHDQSGWLERNVVHEARERFDPLLITHVIVDPNYQRGALLPGD